MLYSIALPPLDLSWIPASQISAGAMVGIIFLALAKDWLITGPAHRREIATTEKAHDETLVVLRRELAEIREDRDYYRSARHEEKERGDALSTKMTDNVIPLIQGTNKLLEAFTEIGKTAD